MFERGVIDIEHGSFTPLVLSTSGVRGPSAKVTFQMLASLISCRVFAAIQHGTWLHPLQDCLFTN